MMMLSRLLTAFLLTASTSSTAKGEMFSINNLFAKGDGSAPYWKDEQGRRSLLLSTGDKVGVSQWSNRSSYDDYTSEEFFRYTDFEFLINGDVTSVNVSVKVECPADNSVQTIRDLSGCECSAEIKNETGATKNCSCGVCVEGFGDNPIYFDCQDGDYLIENCASLDCSSTCNGPCMRDCGSSSEECPLCDANATDTEEDDPVTDVLFAASRECEIRGSQLICTDQATLSLSGRPDSSVFNVSVTCDVDPDKSATIFEDAPSDFAHYRKADNCTCVVNSKNGEPSGCECSTCPHTWGNNPIVIECSKPNETVIADCPYVDCNAQCGGVCVNDCGFAGDECPLCVDDRPVDSTKTCFDLLTLETPGIQDDQAASYFGIMFDIRVKENSLGILSLEFPVQGPRSNETTVEVAIDQDGSRLFVGESTLSPDESVVVVNDLDEILIAANETITLYIFMEESWLLTSNQGVITERSDLILYPGVGFTSTEIEDVAEGSTPLFSGKLNYRLQRDCKDCPVCKTATPVNLNSTDVTCSTTETNLTCNLETRVTAPDKTYSDLAIEVQCDVKSPADDHNFRDAENCMCSVNVTDNFGSPKSCKCSVCTDGFGPSPVVVQCQNDSVVAECSVIDCNSSCNGDCISSCEASPPQCSLCTEDPTLPETQPPTSSPVATPTSAPTPEEHTFLFEKLTVRLEGGIQLSNETRRSFETTTEKFYRSTFSPQPDSRRRLQELEFTAFDTQVVAKREDFDERGNTVTYEQTVNFRTDAGVVEKDDVRELLLFELTDPTRKKLYKDALHAGHPDFQSIVEVNPEQSRTGDDDDAGFDWLLYVIIGAGALLLCCCCCLLFLLLSRRNGGQHEKDHDYDERNDIDPDAPEGPAFDASEGDTKDKFDISEQSEEQDHTDFSQEQINGTDTAVPLGGEGNIEADDSEDDSGNGSEGSYGFN